MHIAVLDDDVASRNQMNRLLTRESDANKKNGLEGYYIDLYGNVNSLMPKAAMYDAIFIDMVECDPKGHEIAKTLYSQGINARLILCKSVINYSQLLSDDMFLHMDKPIKTNELSDILKICRQSREQREPKIELRTKTETLYVKYDDFMYAQSAQQSKTDVLLESRGKIRVLLDLHNFKKDMSPYDFIRQINNDTIINVHRIKSVSAFSVQMDDGTQFKISLPISSKLKKIKSGALHEI